MPPGIRVKRFAPGFASIISRSSRPAKAFVFCLSCCPRKVLGSILLSPNGCMANATWLSTMECLRLSSWLNASVPTLGVPMNLILSFPKRLREYALGNRWRQGQCFTEWARAATEQGRYEQAHALLSESLVLYQALGDQQRLGWVRYLLAHLLFVWQQDQALARALAEQSLVHFRERGDTPYSVYPLGLLGLMHLEQGELEAARPLLEESLAIGKQTGVETDAIELCLGLARLLALQGDAAAARRLYQEGLTLLFECNVYQEAVAA